jgi:hypothetical protein
MSGVGFRANTAQVATGTSAKTILQVVAAANHRIVVNKIVVSFEGVTVTDAPIQVRVLRQSTAGTMSALTLVKDDSTDDETLQTTGLHTATAEPTAGDVLESQMVHPQSSRVFVGPYVVPGGGRLGVEVTAAVGVDCIVSAYGEE